MIPAAAQRIIGNRTMPFDSDSLYAVDGVFMNELHALTLRLGTDQRMSSDEMRDWMNLLHLRLERAAPVYDLGKEA